jgi:hypothetical protein
MKYAMVSLSNRNILAFSGAGAVAAKAASANAASFANPDIPRLNLRLNAGTTMRHRSRAEAIGHIDTLQPPFSVIGSGIAACSAGTWWCS